MLAQGGNIDGARVIQNDIQSDEQQAYTRNRQGLADKRQATMDEQAASKAAAEQRLNILKGVSNKLSGLPMGTGQRKAKLMEALPLFQWSGYPKEVIDQLAQLPEESLSDEAMAMTVGEADTAYKQFMQTRDGNIVGVRESGQVDSLYASKPSPDWRERKNADGSSEWFDINAGQGGGQPGPQGSAPAPRPQRPMGDPDAVVAPFISEGARVTSSVRTPERNAAVGGVNNSYHLQSNGGSARDLVPPQGVSMSQFHRRVQEGLPPGWQAINEGDHVHIEPSSYQVAQAGGNTPRPGGIRGDAPKPKGRMATQEDRQRLGLPSTGSFWIDPDGKPSGVGGDKADKAPTEYQSKATEYMSAAFSGNERLNDLAKQGIYKPRSPTDSLFTREKDGTARLVLRTEEDRLFMQAAKEWLAPILRKDTGAAVTDSELAYYMDIYIPKFEDSPALQMQKARARGSKMRAIYTANKKTYDETFGEPAPWQVLTDPRGVPKPKSAGGKRPPLDKILPRS
jgi:hypothetical protein